MPLGKKLIEQYRAIEAAASLATSKHLHEIEASLNTPPRYRGLRARLSDCPGPQQA
jgi:hypothetical protein